MLCILLLLAGQNQGSSLNVPAQAHCYSLEAWLASGGACGIPNLFCHIQRMLSANSRNVTCSILYA